MKKLFLSIALVALTGIIFANAEGTKDKKAVEQSAPTTTLTGSVVDMQTGEALTGVEVSIEGTDIKAYSDFDGNFTFSNLKPGEYSIVASFISYKKSLVENYNTNTKNSVNIKLQAD